MYFCLLPFLYTFAQVARWCNTAGGSSKFKPSSNRRSDLRGRPRWRQRRVKGPAHAATFAYCNPQYRACNNRRPPCSKPAGLAGGLQGERENFYPCKKGLRRPPREREVPGSNPACAGIFSGSSHTSDLKIGTPVATLPGAWRYRVSTGTGRPGVSIL